MKRAFLILLVSSFCLTALGQGLVNFFNTPATLISIGEPRSRSAITGSVGSYYFALLTAPVGTTDPTQFTFTGVYGTNQLAAGRFTGGAVAVDGWAPGTTRAFMVVGWGAVLGTTFVPAWLLLAPWERERVGLSAIGQGSPGGFNPNTGVTDPNLPIFGPNTLAQGFNIDVRVAPEPSALSFIIVGGAAMLIYRWGKKADRGSQ